MRGDHLKGATWFQFYGGRFMRAIRGVQVLSQPKLLLQRRHEIAQPTFLTISQELKRQDE
jgi:hypothetical protein